MPDAPKLTDAELDARIAASIRRILDNVERRRTGRERQRQQDAPTTTTDRTTSIIPEAEDA